MNAQKFLKKITPFILSGIGTIGVISTAIMSAKAAPKALSLLEDAEKNKNKKLTILEKIRIVAPVYIPTLACGTVSLACLVGPNILINNKQLNLIGAYPVICNTCPTGNRKICCIKDPNSINNNEEKELFYDFYSGRYFESTRKIVLEAEYKINCMMLDDHEVKLNAFYDFLGLENLKEYEPFGWSSYELERKYSYPWIDFEHEMLTIDDANPSEEMEYTVINMVPNPFILEVE